MTNQLTRPSSPRSGARTGLTVAARLTWKDANGAVRFTAVRTREVSDSGVVVECEARVSLPLYRLVHLQVEKSARDVAGLPAVLREGRVLSAVWQASACRPDTGTPESYALRFMQAPAAGRADAPVARRAS